MGTISEALAMTWCRKEQKNGRSTSGTNFLRASVALYLEFSGIMSSLRAES